MKHWQWWNEGWVRAAMCELVAGELEEQLASDFYFYKKKC